VIHIASRSGWRGPAVDLHDSLALAVGVLLHETEELPEALVGHRLRELRTRHAAQREVLDADDVVFGQERCCALVCEVEPRLADLAIVDRDTLASPLPVLRALLLPRKCSLGSGERAV
jgi:hypothetical protein